MSSTTKTILGVLAIIAITAVLFITADDRGDDQPQATTTPATSTEQTQADIPADWQQYENARLDVALSHPADATVRAEGPENRHIKVTYLGSDNATGEITDGFTLTISSYDKPPHQPLRDFVAAQVDENVAAQETSDIATTTFRNQSAFTYTTETLGSITHTAFAPSDDRVIILSSNISDPNNNNYQALADQITASLSFAAINGGDEAAAETVSEIELVLLNRQLANGEEPDRGCDQLAPITRSIEPTQAPLTAALQELFALNRTEVQGFHNFIAKTNNTLSFERASVNGGTANIYLSGELSGVAGVCDNPRAQIQITETALQFPTVEDVQIYLNGEPTELTPSGRGS